MTIRIKTKDQFRCALVGVLHDIKQGRIDVQNEGGLCSVVKYNMVAKYGWTTFRYEDMTERVNDALCAGFAAWPEYSGDRVYPVPAPSGFQIKSYASRGAAREIYSAAWGMAISSITHWGKDEYGQTRWRLLDFMIEYYSS